tara:strand:- start:1687 stop:2640 length:954 start_codon:yes stop_codon:yes gene_type:complete
MATSPEAIFSPPARLQYSGRDEVPIPDSAVLIHGTLEERSEVDSEWIGRFSRDYVAHVIENDGLSSIEVLGYGTGTIRLRVRQELDAFASKMAGRQVYLDITGLSHHVWMPVLRSLLESSVDVLCMYVEPDSYKFNPNPRPGEFFDLSERIRGLSPIPTFAKLVARAEQKPIFVPLLGFEGVRFRYLVENIEPSVKDVFPVVGVPGFRLDYPFHTIEGNAGVLSSTRSWQQVEYVDAACPFSLFAHLHRLRERRPGRPLQIAIVGTKPHALGAALFALSVEGVELVHDHPIRKKGRTAGSGRCHLYRVGDFHRTHIL